MRAQRARERHRCARRMRDTPSATQPAAARYSSTATYRPSPFVAVARPARYFQRLVAPTKPLLGKRAADGAEASEEGAFRAVEPAASDARDIEPQLSLAAAQPTPGMPSTRCTAKSAIPATLVPAWPGRAGQPAMVLLEKSAAMYSSLRCSVNSSPVVAAEGRCGHTKSSR